MNIVICVKPVRKDLVMGQEDGNAQMVLNPYDLRALQCTLECKVQDGFTVSCISMGPLGTEDMLRRCLAMGVDKSILLYDARFGGADTYATAYVLSRAIERIHADLVVCGERSIDGETGQIPHALAYWGGYACIDSVERILSVTKEDVLVSRKREKYTEIVQVPIPALLQICGFSTEYENVNLLQLKRVHNKPLERWDADDLSISPEHCGQQGSKTRVWQMKKNISHKKRITLDGDSAQIAAQILLFVEAIRREKSV